MLLSIVKRRRTILRDIGNGCKNTNQIRYRRIDTGPRVSVYINDEIVIQTIFEYVWFGVDNGPG